MENQKKILNKEWVFIFIALLPMVIFLLCWKRLPDQVPMHYNLEGEIDDWGSKWEMIALLGGMNVFMYFLFRYIPHLDPKRFKDQAWKSYNVIRMITSLFICLISLYIVGSTLTQSVSFISTGLPITMCLLLIGLGNYFPVMKPNYFIGIRTPYTLENEEVWKKTHVYFGRIWFWGGIGLIPFAIFLPEPWNVISVVGFILATTALSFVLSFKWHKKLKS
jgi:uncharacterized membrane protein